MRPIALSLLFCVSVVSMAADLLTGKWHINTAKSKYGSGNGPARHDLEFALVPGGIRYASNGVDSKGAAFSSAYTAKFDGKEYPVSGSKKWAPVVVKRVDERTIQSSYLLHGKVQATAVSAVSADGRTLTVTTTGTAGAGKSYENVGVYERR